MIPMVGQFVDGPSGFGTLRLDEPLGAGAFGLVFRAIDTTSNKLVAVKFPQIGVFSDNTELVAFANEVRAAGTIEHPNVVRVLFTKEELAASEVPYLVMEYIQGGTLKQYLDEFRRRNSPLPESVLKVWMGQLVDGIEAINDQMLHRDIRPDNILVDGNTLKIADFGLSKVVGAITRTKTFKGAQHVLYMAPEGWKLESNAIQLDMYSMGIVFFEMMTLNFPYELPGDLRDFEGLMQMHLFQPPKRIRDFRQDIPTSVDQIVQRMLAKRTQDRFADWNEVRQALITAWNASVEQQIPAVHSLTQQLLEEMSLSYKKTTAEQGERERLARTRAEERRIDDWQIAQLLKGIRQSIGDLNKQSALGSVELVELYELGEKMFAFEIPFAGKIKLRFFHLYPPLQLRRGSVRVFGHLADEDGVGFNYLLVRKSSDDIYGQWEVCKIGIHAFVDPRKLPPRLQPFGFDSEHTFREEMQFAEGIIHVYTYQFEEVTPTQFLEIVREFVRRRRERQQR